MGEPNRLYLFGPRWHWMLGLPANRSLEETWDDRDGIPSRPGDDGPLGVDPRPA